MGFLLKVVQNPRHKKKRLQIWAAIIFDPRGSWKLIFGDCVAQGHYLKFLEPIFIFDFFANCFCFFENLHLEKTENSGFVLIFRAKFSFNSSQKCNFRFFGLLNNPGYHCSCYLDPSNCSKLFENVVRAGT